jgi:hypothetical protein
MNAGHENAEGGTEDGDIHAHVRRLIKTPIQITRVVHVSLILSTPSFTALTFVKGFIPSVLDRSFREGDALRRRCFRTDRGDADHLPLSQPAAE